jgi:VWFA-related protein
MKQMNTVVLMVIAAIVAVSVGAEEVDEAHSERVGGLAFVDEVQITVVNVDVYVRDRKGMPVNGLKADEFVIFQDGIEMPVSNFAEFDVEVISRRMAEAAEAGPVVSDEPTDQTAEPEIKPMWVVLYIDQENLETLDRNRVLRRVREFVTENLDEPVRMMVVSYQRSLKVVQPFTSESREVTGALRGMAKQSTGREESESARQELLRAMADARNQDHGSDRNSQDGAELGLRQRVASFAAEEAFNLRLAIDGLRQVIAMMSGIDGRKTLVYVSSGLPMVPGIGLMHDHAMTFHDQTILSMRGRYDQTRLFHELTSMANAQEVSLYSIDASGLNPLDGMGVENNYSRDPTASSIGSKNYKDSLVYMAEATGGIAVVNTNDVTGGMERISDDLYNYYSLGYTVNSSNEDRVHRIKVEVKGDQNYNLRFRRRFVEKSQQSRIQDRVFTSLVVDINDNPMGLELAAGAPVAGSQTQWMLPLHLSIDLSKIALLTLGDDLVGRVVVFIGARDEEGRKTEVQQQEHEISMPKADYLTAGRERFGIDFRLLLDEGRHRISVGVMDPITRQDSYEKIVVSVP